MGRSWTLHGLRLTDLTIQVPVNYQDPQSAMSLYARIVEKDDGIERPYLLWLQGGPGGRAQRPTGMSGWIKAALDRFRVVLLDQRGTGRSNPIYASTLDPQWTDEEIARYLVHFRAPNIIRDAERLREHLGCDSWWILGQSYGGFLALSYLSMAGDSLDGVFITAGLGDLSGDARHTYEHTFSLVEDATEEFLGEVPFARQTICDLHEIVTDRTITLPTGQRLRSEHIQALGIQLGTDAGWNQLAFQLETALVQSHGNTVLSETFLYEVVETLSFAKKPLYGILHETIYSRGLATKWAAQRVYDERRYGSGDCARLTGEAVFPWMFNSDPALVPFEGAAHILAGADGLEDPYTLDILERNRVPVVAAVHDKDIFVPAAISLETAARVGNLRVVRNSKYRHDGIRSDGENLLNSMFEVMDEESISTD